MKTGDAIATLTQPIARGIDYVFGSNIQDCPGCKRRQEFANSLYDRFFSKEHNETTNMQYVITKQIAVEADSPEEAVTKITEGKTISISVNPRPQPQAQLRPAVGQAPK